MGMFDSIFLDCPTCGERLELQSKAGECQLHVYSPDEVPIIIAEDLKRGAICCEKCLKAWRVKEIPENRKTTRLMLCEEVDDA